VRVFCAPVLSCGACLTSCGWSWPSGAACTVVLLAAGRPAQNAGPDLAAIERAAAGRAIERPLAPTPRCASLLPLQAGDYVEVTVEQLGIDASSR
jgi:hypothetical protein